jgi:hypothetical protein
MTDSLIKTYFTRVRDSAILKLYYSNNCLNIHKNITNKDLNKQINFKDYLEKNPNSRLISIHNEHTSLVKEIVDIEDRLDRQYNLRDKYKNVYKANKQRYGIFPNKLQRMLLEDMKNKYIGVEGNIEKITLEQLVKGNAYKGQKSRIDTIIKMTSQEYLAWLSKHVQKNEPIVTNSNEPIVTNSNEQTSNVLSCTVELSPKFTEIKQYRYKADPNKASSGIKNPNLYGGGCASGFPSVHGGVRITKGWLDKVASLKRSGIRVYKGINLYSYPYGSV